MMFPPSTESCARPKISLHTTYPISESSVKTVSTFKTVLVSHSVDASPVERSELRTSGPTDRLCQAARKGRVRTRHCWHQSLGFDERTRWVWPVGGERVLVRLVHEVSFRPF